MNHTHDMTEEEYEAWRKRQDWGADHEDDMIEYCDIDLYGDANYVTVLRRSLPYEYLQKAYAHPELYDIKI